MRRGIFGFDIWFYGIVALLLAVCQQPLVLGGLMLFVMLVEKDEWLNRQVMQALLMCLGVMAVSLLVHKLSAVFVIVPFFGWMLRWGVDQVVDLLLLLGMALFAIRAAAHPQGKEEFCGMVIKGVAYGEKKTAGERLVLACSELPNAEEKVIGSYRGFELSLRFDAFRTEYQALLKGQRKYTVPLGTDPLGNIIRLDNSLNNFPERITAAENELATLHQQQAAAQIEVEKPFPQEEELAEKSARLAELNAQLDVDEKSHEPEQDEQEQADAPRRPSVLAALEEKTDKPEPVRPFKSYLDKDGDAR